MTPLSVVQVAAIEATRGPSWLIEGLWSDEACGLIGGAPKLGKTWLALDMALSVASGTPALGTYPVPRAGPVLVFAAEDPPETVRARLEGLSARRRLRLDRVPVHLILASGLRLDTSGDQARLADAVDRFRPRLLVLDPFVRLHRIDENSALEVSGVLAYLRTLQREHRLAVLVVHHARKSGAGPAHAGLSLRGSGDFHAWGDSNLYLRRRRAALEMVIEHRSASSPDPVHLELCTQPDGTAHLSVLGAATIAPKEADLKQRILDELTRAGGPTTQQEIRERLRVRLQRLVRAMRALQEQGRLQRTAEGWSLTTSDVPPRPPINQALLFPTDAR